MNNFDKRITPARADLAALSLRGKIEVPRFVAGEEASIAVGRASLRAAPSADAAQDTELLHGERVTVYERKNGWAWVQAANDGYVGYLREECLSPPFAAQLQISALMTPVFSKPDLKSPVRDMLPLTAEVNLLGREGAPVSCRPAGGGTARLCRGGGKLFRCALCLGRQDLRRDRLLRPDPDRTGGLRHPRPARYRHDGAAFRRQQK